MVANGLPVGGVEEFVEDQEALVRGLFLETLFEVCQPYIESGDTSSLRREIHEGSIIAQVPPAEGAEISFRLKEIQMQMLAVDMFRFASALSGGKVRVYKSQAEGEGQYMTMRIPHSSGRVVRGVVEKIGDQQAGRARIVRFDLLAGERRCR